MKIDQIQSPLSLNNTSPGEQAHVNTDTRLRVHIDIQDTHMMTNSSAQMPHKT